MKKRIIDKETNDYEFDIIQTSSGKYENTFQLCASNNNIWNPHIQGKTLIEIVDDGNGIVLKLRTDKNGQRKEKKLSIGYDTQHELRTLLNFVAKFNKKERKNENNNR